MYSEEHAKVRLISICVCTPIRKAFSVSEFARTESFTASVPVPPLHLSSDDAKQRGRCADGLPERRRGHGCHPLRTEYRGAVRGALFCFVAVARVQFISENELEVSAVRVDEPRNLTMPHEWIW